MIRSAGCVSLACAHQQALCSSPPSSRSHDGVVDESEFLAAAAANTKEFGRFDLTGEEGVLDEVAAAIKRSQLLPANPVCLPSAPTYHCPMSPANYYLGACASLPLPLLIQCRGRLLQDTSHPAWRPDTGSMTWRTWLVRKWRTMPVKRCTPIVCGPRPQSALSEGVHQAFTRKPD